MEVDLEVFRARDKEPYCRYDFASVLRRAALRTFGDMARRGKIELTLEEAEAGGTHPGPPEVRNLVARDGNCVLRLIQDGKTAQEVRLPTVDLVGPVLADELRQVRPGERHWSFRLRQRRVTALIVLGDKIAEQLTRLSGRPEPVIEGSMDVDPRKDRHQPFEVTQIEDQDEQLVQPADLGLDPDQLDRVNVLMPAKIHQQLLKDMPLATTMEEGGFLLGRVAKADERTHLVEITHVTPAHRSGAGMIHFTFTGESFLAVHRLIEERGQAEKLVGWYHTHLLGVGIDMGLSSIDEDLHLATFQRPWQVAALINIRKRDRLLRFFGRGDKDLQEYDLWISDDSGGYRPAHPELGGE
ncbi:JAB N-terminal domain-containing protein [Actinocrispum wychmicini]|uniref:JAB-N domain-containing protein n=1 Tax=Actinocrispum wychmicini TaxID=1213861 RepID=A0A4R2J5Z7_9PSEU|nr:JAB N-terminal domain-containing protein [Actinocrispum wychmicini]TCO52882.1 hypothetical protein EV192_11176 [Actinocrispum wychmicini]